MNSANDINRRRLLQAALGAAGATAFALPPFAGTATAGKAGAGLDDWQAAFRAALAERPWLLGYEGIDRDSIPRRTARLDGRLPPALAGTLYRNGPARHEIGGFRYRHWFDGDGMVQAWRIGAGRVEHHARMVHTRKYLEERAAGRALYPAFGSIPPEARPVASPDAINAANISVLPRGDELWALWEAGSPWRLDPDTLESLGVQTFSPETRGLPFSAHPRAEPDGTLWNFGYASDAGRLVLWRLNPDGSLGQVSVIPVAPMTMPHDFLVTERHIVLLLPPLDFEPDSAAATGTEEAGLPVRSFLDSHVWHPERGTRVLVVEKHDMQTRFWLELPAQWVFHFGNAWEDDAGIIRFDGASARTPELLFGSLRGVMRGAPPDPGEPVTSHVLYRIDTRRRRATQERVGPADLATEFPAVDPRRSARSYRWVTLLGADAKATGQGPVRRAPDSKSRPQLGTGFDSVARLDLETGTLRRFRYPENQIPEEHLFVPDPQRSSESAGWILGTALDWQARSTLLNVFNADAIESGPVATASLPEAMPLGLHGRFAAAGSGEEEA